MKGQTVLLTSWAEPEKKDEGNGMWSTIISPGEPRERALFEATIERWHATLDRPQPSEEVFDDLIGEKATVLTVGENFIGGRLLSAREGRVFTRNTTERPGPGYAILPKGSRSNGFILDTRKIFDVLPGWAAADAAEMMRRVRDGLPTLRPLTQERLLELPSSSNECSLCVFGRWSLDGTQHDALYLVTNYLRGDDIIEGLLLIRPSVGFSETGSCWGRDLLRMGGEVVGYSPISIGEAIGLTELPFEAAYERVLGNCVGAAA